MINPNDPLNSVDNPDVELIRARAVKQILFEANGSIGLIDIGAVFLVNLIPLDDLKGSVAHYNGESFFVDHSEWVPIYS